MVDDYDVVLTGLAHMLGPYQGRVRVVELHANEPVSLDVDIALYDSFAQPESDHDEVAVLVANPRARRVVIYTLNFHPDLARAAHDLGVDSYLSKTLPARALVGPSKPSTPASGLSAIHRPGHRPRPGWTGPGAAKG